ncbi:hypothetical protein [Candidatus Neptunochlamydia vexilliferae]|uniref:Uncharacterized protein n=1 Tax=Candidatus Neptunichlamydia vexilliferae TaxID=1651774 RepID=A0ABS0AYA9_9BACT|nr:hypothetical protein [Candidatus Neptunochlamydia vexilliferae]MBF5058950.1 hypothetical protein [Candidatus Neptunochlamydia vexilliferae]
MKNDCLGLATHPHVKKMGMKALLEWGVTAPPSFQEEVEDQLADLLGKEAALLLPYPYPLTLEGTVFVDKRCTIDWIRGSSSTAKTQWIVTTEFKKVGEGAHLIVDDSSSFGIAGKLGMGLSAHRKEVSIIFAKTPFGVYLGLRRSLKKLLCDQNPLLAKAATLSAPVLGALSGALELIPDMDLEREQLEPLGESCFSMNTSSSFSQV